MIYFLKTKIKSRVCSSSDCLPADPVGRDAVQSKQSELEVVRGAGGFFAASSLCSFPVCSLGQRRWVEGGGRGAEGAQVELGQVVDSLCQQGHALLHGAGVTCQVQEEISVKSKRYHQKHTS